MSLTGSAPSFNPENIPQELIARDQWVLWHLEGRNKAKPTKVPYTVRGTLASSTNPRMWGSFDDVCQAYSAAQGRYSGIGFVLAEDDPFVGVDLDHCIHGGAVDDWARAIVDRLDSYTEVTPSGEGLRVFVKGQLPEGGRKRGNFEIYSSGRYLTITGNHLEGAPWEILERQSEVEAVHSIIFEQTGPSSEFEIQPDSSPSTLTPGLSQHLVIDLEAFPPMQKLIALLGAVPEFRRSWDRERSNQWSQSEYDLSVANWAAHAGWSNQEIVNAVICHRRIHGQDLDKVTRLDYFTSPVYGLLVKVKRW